MTKPTRDEALGAINQLIARTKDKPNDFFPKEAEALKLAAEMLKAIEEPKPDFYVGWTGKVRSGFNATIEGRHGDKFSGVIHFPDGEIMPVQWSSAGRADKDGESCNDLIPNHPPEPEIYWRPKDDPMMLYSNKKHAVGEMEAAGFDADYLEKVEVRVVK